MITNDMFINIGIIVFIAERTLSIFVRYRKNGIDKLIDKIDDLITEIKLDRISRRN